MLHRVRLLGIVAAVSVVVAAVACGSEVPDSDFANGNGDGSSGGNTSGGTFGGGVDPNAASDAAAANDGNAANCFAPVDMYIMFDRSGSMGSDCTIGQGTSSKWCRAITALSGYFKSAGAANQAAALQFFPHSSHNDNLCDTGSVYDKAAVPGADFTTLPSSDFDAILNQTNPGGDGTPTEAAIRGLVKFTSTNRRPGKVTIGILVTDGNPNGCDENLTNLSNILQAHYAATQIRTYVIGMQGASFDRIEQIAQGGNSPAHPDAVGTLTDACGDGAGPCRHWNVGDGDPTAFAAALAAIQESADGCKAGGGVVNPGPK